MFVGTGSTASVTTIIGYVGSSKKSIIIAAPQIIGMILSHVLPKTREQEPLKRFVSIIRSAVSAVTMSADPDSGTVERRSAATDKAMSALPDMGTVWKNAAEFDKMMSALPESGTVW